MAKKGATIAQFDVPVGATTPTWDAGAADFPATAAALQVAIEKFKYNGDGAKLVLRVIAPKSDGGIRRGGMRHEGTVDHDAEGMTPEQVEAILTEPRLKAAFVPEGLEQEAAPE